MQVIEIGTPGPPSVLRLAERPDPQPGAGEVLIRVEAAGVNRPDLAQRLGKYAPPPGASDVPGLEVAGTIERVGPEVSDWHAGDRVCALVAGGGYATLCVAPSAQCLRMPAGLSSVEAAALPETFFTVWTNVFERGGLRHGEAFLVHGGSSGIGTTAIQLAAAFGATVFTTAGTAAKCAACERLGARRAINYREEDFVAVVRDETSGRGVDLILDMVGGDYVGRNLDALAMNGRLVQIADLHRVDAPAPNGRGERRDCRGASPACLAARRERRRATGHLQDVPPGRGRLGARGAGTRRARRKDRARRRERGSRGGGVTGRGSRGFGLTRGAGGSRRAPASSPDA